MKKSPFSSENVPINKNRPSFHDSPFVQMKLKMAREVIGKIKYTLIHHEGSGWLLNPRPPRVGHLEKESYAVEQ